MTDRDNAETVRRALAALEAGDLARFAEMFAPDATWHVPGVSPISGDYRGRNAILMLFARIAGIADGSYRFDVVDVMASDRHVVHWQRVRATCGARRLEIEETIVSRVVGGRIAEVWQFTDLYEHDAFFRGAPWRRRRRRVHGESDEAAAVRVEAAPRRAVAVSSPAAGSASARRDSWRRPGHA